MATLAHPSWIPHGGPLHKRGHSGSSMSFRNPEYLVHVSSEERDSFENNRYTTTTAAAIAAPSGSGSAGQSSHGHTKKIKPYLRKLSLKGADTSSLTIDLSRPAAENESLAGLGFYHDDSRSGSGSELAFPSPTFIPSPTATTHAGARSGMSRHQRSTSNNSTFSIASHQRPTAPYAHPMRATPPLHRSYTAQSLLADEDEDSSEAVDRVSDDAYYRTRVYSGGAVGGVVGTSRRSGSIGSLPAATMAPQLLHTMHSSPSLTRLNNSSQSSLPSSSFPNSTATGRSRGDTLKSVDSSAAVPSSARTSMEKAMGYMFRGSHVPGTPKTPEDGHSEAANRAASIMAARVAFAEREEAKERKIEKEAIKAADRAHKKQLAREERQRRKSESLPTSPFVASFGAAAHAHPHQHQHQHQHTSSSASNKKEDFVGIAYADHKPVHSRSLPAHVVSTQAAQAAQAAAASPAIGAAAGPVKWEKNAPVHRSSFKSTWLSFVAWFRTRMFRLGRKFRPRSY